MAESTLAVVALLVLGWAVTSQLLARVNINGPLVFMVAGYALSNPDWGPLTVDVETPSIHLTAEITLALLLFSDASRVNVAKLRHDVGFPLRLLGVGLPMSVVAGSLVAAWLLDDLSWALAGFVGATLAPTDAALSAQVINDGRIPMRVRRTLNVESGLNDGIATPIVVFALAVAADQLDIAGHAGGGPTGGHALRQLALGIGVGLAVGLGSALLISFASRRRWIVTGGRRLGVLAAALSSWAVAVALDGNGFIGAFVAGIAFGSGMGSDTEELESVGELPELLGELLALVVWFLFGAVLVPVALHHLSVSMAAYAVLSLTVVRLVPVALALVGTGTDLGTVLFVGWFGPRGLASVVFALLAVEELGETPLVGTAVAAVSFTVMLSVVLHGVTAGPLGRRYANLERTRQDPAAATPPRARRHPVTAR